MTNYPIVIDAARPPPSTPALPVVVVKKIDAVIAHERRGINLRHALSELMLRASFDELVVIAERLESKAECQSHHMAWGAGGYLHYARLARRFIRQRSQRAA